MAVYRNLQEQVFENTKDIEELQNKGIDPDTVVSIVTPLIDEKVDNIRKIHSDNKQDAYVEFSNDSSWYSQNPTIPHLHIHQRQSGQADNDIRLDRLGINIHSYNGEVNLTSGFTHLTVYDDYASLTTTNRYNPDAVAKTRSLWYYGEYFKHLRYHGDTFDEYKLNLPTKSGTFALLEDLPEKTGTLKIGDTTVTEEQLQRLLQLI